MPDLACVSDLVLDRLWAGELASDGITRILGARAMSTYAVGPDSATEILVTPGGAIPSSCSDITGPMTVTNINTGDNASGQSFTYIVKNAGPFITSVSPGSGSGGSVTITGGNFASITTVTIGNATAACGRAANG